MQMRLNRAMPVAPATLPAPVSVAPATPPSTRPLDPDEKGLLSLRAFVILATSFVIAIITGVAGGLTAGYSSSDHSVAIGVIAGLAVFMTSFVGTATGMDALIAKQHN